MKLSTTTKCPCTPNTCVVVLLIFLMQQYSTTLFVVAFQKGHSKYHARLSIITPLFSSKLTNGPSYSDDWLLGFHNNVQNEKQLVTNSLAIWNEEQQQAQRDILEWQESFQRNGLADFTPPMSAGLNCLMVGGDIDNQPRTEILYDDSKLPWEDLPEADITSLRVVSTSAVQQSPDLLLSSTDTDNDHRRGGTFVQSSTAGLTSVSTMLVSMPSRNSAGDQALYSTKIRRSDKEAAVYDCIVDQGLLGAVLHSEETVQELLLEASVALREHGIYVLVTGTLSDETKALLEGISLEAGLEWQFELDGISDEASQVSVARRFCTGAMPKVGKLSRYQP